MSICNASNRFHNIIISLGVICLDFVGLDFSYIILNVILNVKRSHGLSFQQG